MILSLIQKKQHPIITKNEADNVYSNFILVSVATSNLIAKNNFQYYLSKADSLYNIKEFKTAALYYDSILLTTKKPSIEFYYNTACIYSLAENLDKFFLFLNKCVDNNYIDLNSMNNDPDLLNCRKDIRWKEMEEKINLKILKLDTVLIRELSEINFQDQTIRQQLYEYEKQQNNDMILFGKLIKEMQFIDSINLLKVENIIKKYGWPEISKIGRNGNHTIWLVIQHNPKVQEKYYPLLKKSVRKGESSKTDLAYLEDRINAIVKNKKQKYGTQYSWNKSTQKTILSPLKYSIKRTNRLRAKLGLNTIEENFKSIL